MHFPKLPDWLVYAAVVLALLIAAVGRREQANAPQPPPPVPGEGGVPLGPSSPFDPSVVVEVPQKTDPGLGTAFSVADRGVWITARHVVEGCDQVAIVVAEGRGVAAKAIIDIHGDAAVGSKRKTRSLSLSDGVIPACFVEDIYWQTGARGNPLDRWPSTHASA